MSEFILEYSSGSKIHTAVRAYSHVVLVYHAILSLKTKAYGNRMNGL